MSFPTYVDLNYGMERLKSTTPQFPVGIRGVMPDGKAARYCLADEALVMNPALGAANGDQLHFMNSAVEGAIGDMDITVVVDTVDTGGYAVDQFKDGYISIHTTIIQRCLKIVGNDVSGTNVVLHLAEPLLETTALPTFVEIHENKYHSIEVMNAAGLQTVVVVPFVPVGINEYFWGQTWGECLCAASHGGGMGAVVNERNVYFQDDGSIGSGLNLPPTSGFQFAGYVIPRTERDGSAADSIHFFLMLTP